MIREQKTEEGFNLDVRRLGSRRCPLFQSVAPCISYCVDIAGPVAGRTGDGLQLYVGIGQAF